MFWVVKGEKRQKTIQDDKKLCPSRCHAWYFRNHTSYLRFIHFLKILIFWVIRGSKRAKSGLKWQKILSIALHISGTSYDCHLCRHTTFPDWSGIPDLQNSFIVPLDSGHLNDETPRLCFCFWCKNYFSKLFMIRFNHDIITF